MRVVYILDRADAPSEEFIRREIRGVGARGIEIEVFALRGRASAGSIGDAPVRIVPPLRSPRFWFGLAAAALRHPRRALAVAGSVVALEPAPGNLYDRARALRLALLAIHLLRWIDRRAPALLHAHFASRPASVCAALAQACGLSWGFSVHASDLYAERNRIPEKLASAAYALACSQQSAEDLRARCGASQSQRVHTVHHGLDLDTWALGSEARPDDLPLILAVGRFVPKKGFDVLVDACALLAADGFDFRCEIVGAGPEEASLRERIRELDLAGRVALRGWQSPARLRAEGYERARVLALPCRIAPDGNRDNLPNVLLEAAALGVPVVASRLPAIARIVEPTGAAALVPVEDARALAEAIRGVCTSPELARALRTRGRKLVETHFDLRITAERIAEIHRDHAASPDPV